MDVEEVPRLFLYLSQEPFHAQVPIDDNGLLRRDVPQIISLGNDRPQAGDEELHHHREGPRQDGDIPARDKTAFHIKDQVRNAKGEELGKDGLPDGVLRHFVSPVNPHKPAVNDVVKKKRYHPSRQAVRAESIQVIVREPDIPEHQKLQQHN